MKKYFLSLLLFGVIIFCGFIYNYEVFADDSDFSYKEVSGGVCITDYTGAGGNVVIPSSLDSKNVIEISEDAFSWNEGITAITIPAYVSSIDNYAFCGCKNISAFTVNS